MWVSLLECCSGFHF